MRGAASVLLPMAVLLTSAMDTGIDRGEFSCSRETGGGALHAEKGDRGAIVSGGYPGNYSTEGRSGLWCQVHLQVCSTCRLHLHLEELSFMQCDVTNGRGRRRRPNRDFCYKGCDHIHIHEVDPPYDKVTHRDYFLDNQGDHYTSISGNVKIRHCAGNTSVEDGRRFKISYKVIDKSSLHQGMVSDYGSSSGVLKSPNFPHGYALNGETFTFMIQNLDPYGHIRLTFDDWDIAPESKVTLYDGVTSNSAPATLPHHRRPVILSESSTLVLVLSTGTKLGDCCFYTGFKGRFQFVSDRLWDDRPDTSCSESHPLKSGGTILFTGGPSSITEDSSIEGPHFYDCVWLLKRYSAVNTAEAVLLQLRELLPGGGWLQYGRRNRLEIRHGVTSQAPLVATYTADNLTAIEPTVTAARGLYIRLTGGFLSTDKLSFMFTAVRNASKDGECPGYSDFLCTNQLCIDQELVCDGADHCGDGSDESPRLDCAVSSLWKHGFNKWGMPYVDDAAASTAMTPCDGVSCGTRCISLTQICDGVWDCLSGLDEKECVQVHTYAPDRRRNGMTSLQPSPLVICLALCCHLIISLLHRSADDRVR